LSLIFQAIRWNVWTVRPDASRLPERSHAARTACFDGVFGYRFIRHCRVENVMVIK